MKTILSAAVVAALTIALVRPAPGAMQDEMSPRERARHVASFEKVWTTVRDRHWDPKLGGVDWQAVHDELAPRIGKARSASDVRRVLNDMLGRLKQSHFGVFPAGASSDEEPAPPKGEKEGSGAPTSRPGQAATRPAPVKRSPRRGMGRGRPGFTVKLVEGAPLVVSVDEGSPAAAAGVVRGLELVSFDGDDVMGLVEAVRSDKEIGIENEDFYSVHVQRMLSGRPGDEVRCVFRKGGDTVEKEIELVAAKGRSLPFGNMPAMPVWLESRRIGEDIGYIAFNMFLNPAIVQQFAEAVHSFSDCKGIIVDVRGNPGGLGLMSGALAGHLVKKPGQFLGRMLQGSSTIKFFINPRPGAFLGPVAVLIDGGSASTSEIFAGGLQDIGRARVFGTRSAGAALPSVIEKLPNGDLFQYAVADCERPGGKKLEGVGVTPDVEVRHTRLALQQGRDAVVDAAAAWIRSNQN